MHNTAKYFVSTVCLICSFNGFAATPVLATVNGSDISIAAVENFRLHIKKSMSFKDALSSMIEIEALVSHRLTTNVIKKDSPLQLELDRTRKAMIAADTLETMLSQFKMTDEEVTAEYKKQYLSAAATQEYNANHILVKTEDEALKIIQSLNKNNDFEALAAKHSTGPSGKNGGALGWFTAERMVKPFAQATAALSKGQHTQVPTKTQFGWHIIKLNDMRKKTAPTLKSVTNNIKRRDSSLKLSAEIQKLIKGSDIVINRLQ